MKILIIGKGYIGIRCAEVWKNEAEITETKIYSKKDALGLLDKYQPDAVLNAAGVRGKPNVDWCETHQLETAFGNTILPILIADACKEKGVYLLHIGSGCVFYGLSPDPDGWKEDDFANPIAYYSKTKYAADLCLSTLPGVGIARIRVPLDNKPYAGNIIDKLVVYPKIIDVANSITVIPNMIEVFYQLMLKKAEGIFHVTNPGAIKYRDLLKLYRQYVNPDQKNEWISEEDLVKQGLANKTRSTNTLQSSNLKKYGIIMPEIHQAAEKAMKEYASSKQSGV